MSSFLPTFAKRTRKYGSTLAYETRDFGTAPWVKHRQSGLMTEEIVSQCHLGTWPPMRGSHGDVGGDMSLHRTWISYPETATIIGSLTRGTVAMANMIGYTYGVSPAAAASLSNLNAFGTSAIARVLPTNPSSSLATALGELKQDGLPSLPGASMRDQVDRARRAGNEYLNVEFGWLPLISDLTSFAHSVRNAKVLMDQYIRDSDRKIRRRYTPLPLTQTTSVFTGPGQVSGLNHTCPFSTVTKKTDTKYWFSGAFRYHIPVDDGVINRIRRYESLANHILGTRLTPEVLWELTPWSWAVDWFSNAGDVIHNISTLGSDGLVMQYGYAMRHMRVHEYHRGSFKEVVMGKVIASGTVAKEVGSEWKQRVRANPYGFGIDDISLSARQLAILAALGLTRGQRNS